jgi:ribosomal protein L7/L12
MDQQQLDRRLKAIADRFRAIEEQLAVLSEKAGVDYTPPAGDAPAEVVALATEGKTMEAVKLYRELTGAGADTASEVVLGL